MNDIRNPYIAGAPVVESSMFFGREDVFHWIERSLAGKYVDHILVLHGQRRVGKTSVLKQIPNFLPGKYIQVFFDLQGRTSTTLDRFLWWLASEIVRTLKKERSISLPKPDRKTFEDTEYLINEFLPSLRPLLGEQVLLLTFDEFDTLDQPEIQEKLAKPLIVYLRRLFEMDSLNFIFSIGSSGEKLENMQASYTDFFKSALYRKISFLTRDDCYRLVTKPVEGVIKYEKKAVDQIVKISSGHPYFAQLMCHELFSRCQKTGAYRISDKDVESVLGDVIERGTVNLKFVWDEASDLEKWILAALAQMDGGNNQKLAQVLNTQRVRFSDSDLNSSIIHLQDKDVVTQDNRFVIPLMRMWLVTNRPMDRVREELVEATPIANRYIEIGDEYRDRAQNQAAIESYQQALSANPGNLKAQLRIAAVYLEQKDFSEALAAFDLAMKIDDEDVAARTGYCDANLALGDLAQSRGETDEAISLYQAILVVNPAHTVARQQLAAIYREQAEDLLAAGQDDEALTAFKQAMMILPEDDRLSGRYDEVLAEKKSKVINTWLEKAEKALSRQRWDDAAEMIAEAIKVDPDDQNLQAKLLEVKDAPRQFKLRGYRHEAENALARGNWDKAIAAIEASLQLAPEDQTLADWLDTIHNDQLRARLDLYAQKVEEAFTTGDWDTAIQSVQNAIKIAPKDKSWQTRLDEIKKARLQARVDALHAQASAARTNNRWDDAISALEELLELEDSKTVRTDIESFRKEKRESELAAFRSQAERATEGEKWDEAVQAWDAYLALKPDDRDSIENKWLHARRYANLAGDYTEAQNSIRKKRYGRAIELLQGIIAQDPAYKSTSRLLVEAVEANKAIPVWRRPWVYWASGVVAVVVLGVFFGPRLLKTFSTVPPETPAVEESTNVIQESVELSTTTPLVAEESQPADVLDEVDMGTQEATEPAPTPTADLRILNPENNHLYLSSRDSGVGSHSWGFARDYCVSQGGYLATIQDAAENEFVYELFVFLDQSWLGATDEDEEGTWVWVTGEPWEYTNWNPGEPNDNGGEDYLSFSGGPGWNDISATKILLTGKTQRLYFVCEWDP